MKISSNQRFLKSLILSVMLVVLSNHTYGFDKITSQILANSNQSATTSWSSIELDYTFDHDWVGGNRPDEYPKTYHSDKHFIQSNKGQLFFSYAMKSDNSPSVMKELNYLDGKQAGQRFLVEEANKIKSDRFRITSYFGMENTGRKERPEMLRYQFVGLKPIYDCLAQKNELREQEWLGRKCSVFQFDKVNGANDQLVHEYWIDQKSGWVLRYFLFMNDKDRQQLRPYSEWAATSLDTVQGKQFPLNSVFLQYDNKDPKNSLQIKTTIICPPESIFFDKSYPDSTFWPKLDEETRVVDMIKGKIKMPSSKNIHKNHSPDTPSIIAEEPVSFSNYIAKLLGLVGVVGLLVTGYKKIGGK
jgi:hypothetical protein